MILPGGGRLDLVLLYLLCGWKLSLPCRGALQRERLIICCFKELVYPNYEQTHPYLHMLASQFPLSVALQPMISQWIAWFVISMWISYLQLLLLYCSLCCITAHFGWSYEESKQLQKILRKAWHIQLLVFKNTISVSQHAQSLHSFYKKS